MKTLILFKKLVLVSIALYTGVLFSQVQEVETFNVSDDVLVSINTSHINVVIETWNRDQVEVTAVVDGEDLSEAEKREIMDGWDYDVLGNSKKVVITSNAGNLWSGLSELHKLDALKNLPRISMQEDFNFSMPELNFNFNFPEMPEYDEFPNWPFTEDRPSIKYKNGYMNYHSGDGGSINFNQNDYEKDKQAYVAKLNKKYGTNVSVGEVDRWLDDVDKWSEEFSKLMEDWGEEFGKEFGESFGADFEMKMEKWGEEFGEKFGEKFGKDMEKWGEEFGKDMEKWAEEFEKNAEKWAEEWEHSGHNYSKQIMTDPHGNKTVIIQGDGDGNFKKVKATKTIIIKMPKGAKTDVNVRHGELKMADAYNVKANLDYTRFTANSIDGGNTLINASYAPVIVDNWIDGKLLLKFIDECTLNNVQRIQLDANSSDIIINMLSEVGELSGSFGDVRINKVSPNFRMIELNLDNTDAFIALPNTSFKFDFDGLKSTLLYPKALQLQQEKKNGRVLVNGFSKSRNTDRLFAVNAHYSNLKVQ